MKTKLNFKEIVQKYNNISIQVKAAFWFTVCSIIQKGISFITVPIFTRLLTTEQYGQYSIYQTWLNLITIFATLQLVGGVYNKGLIKYGDDKERFTSSLLGLSTATTSIVFLVYLVGKGFWNRVFDFNSEFSTELVLLMFVEILVTPALGFWSAQQRFVYKYVALIGVTMIIAIGNPILGLVAIRLTSYKGEARIISSVIVQIIVCLFFYFQILKKGKCFFRWEYWKYALVFNLPLIPHYLSQTVLSQSDRLMINNMCGTDKAGIYSVAYNIAIIMTLVTNSVNNTIIPWTYQKFHAKKEKDIVPVANIILVLVGVLSLIVVAIAPEVIQFMASKEYYEAVYVIPPLSLNVFLIFIYTLFVNVEFYYEESKYIMVASCVGAAMNVLLNFFAIQKFDYIAAGYTSLFCYIILCIMHYMFMRKSLKKNGNNNRVYDLRMIVFVSIILFALTFLFLLLYKNIVLRYMLLGILIVVIVLNRRKFVGSILQLIKKNE